MKGIPRVVTEHLQALRPSFMSKNPHFNFITVHYFWIIGLSILGSILIYASGKGSGSGEIRYIDALFFASGANTQAGLNPVDVNLLNTFQQVLITLMSMMSSPITINAGVVFLRLYWFEKRFRNMVKDARQKRGTITKSRSKAINAASDAERGVNGRHITVMHNTAKASRLTNDGILLDDYAMNGAVKSDSELVYSFSAQNDTPPAPRDATIKFADRVTRSDVIPEDDVVGMELPRQRSDAEHIAILERQRKHDKSVLRIPGPRDAERGILPEELDDDDDEIDGDRLSRVGWKRRESSLESPRRESPPARFSSNPERQQTITIAEPTHPNKEAMADAIEASAHVLSSLGPQRNKAKHGDKFHQHGIDNGIDTSTQPRFNALQRIKTALSHNKDQDSMPYLSWQPTLGRNSEFLDLTEEQREELGGIEYRSLKTLAVVMTGYFWGFWVFGLICLLLWMLHNNEHYQNVVTSVGQSPTWWAFFSSNSAFMDLGFTLTPDSMISFATARFPLLIMSFLIIIGNTGFPIMLRAIIWVTHLFVPRGTGLWEELRFLLDHPRRCFTLLFPSTPTWWLFFILVALNALDLIFFIILDLGTGVVAELPLDIKFLDGWFQAAATRTAGFAVVNLADVHPAVQTSYLIMMYISVFPIAISIRRTNVYEEKSLGLYGSTNDIEERNENGFSYVGAHLRRQLSFDLWYIFIGFFILSISEGSRLMAGDFSMFAVLFEIVSAYGTVGLSLGYTGINASLSSQFSVVGKLVVIAMQIRGRHRGLPYGLDRAILLPSESLNRKEAEDAEFKLQRRQSAVSLNTNRPVSLSRGRTRSIDRRNSETFRRSNTEPVSDDDDEPKPRPRRAETQPADSH
ncbi:cation transport protein-domain-containing protein [Pseudomassariella vexata]|uniref:Potassium transport protein n=1 Tax=Pseudomassariella vexata TaxID=1141098 RepID=A0A1Y2EET8_9PEZI|nr:cation transport protein-domain-containing protein [Pseudomassariella vexata]ORY69786.1 cation transport protein-domain-containing protein [Pseudomassariella vexata]